MSKSDNKLNSMQQAAVSHVTGPLLVLAGAGSGKTSVITHKIAHLINNCAYAAKNITAITFTNKAAREMQSRASELLRGSNTRGLNICTFHALGLKILRKEAASLGYKENFSVLDSYDCAKIVSDLVKTTDKSVVGSLRNQISLWKNQLISPEQLLNNASDEFERNNAQIYQLYQDTLKVYQAVDFDDLIWLPVKLFSQDLQVLYRWRQKIRYLLIDEYQDTNLCQYQLIKLLSGSAGLFTAVGDDDQSIYAWRGADSQNLNLLKQDYPELEVIKLEQNYRSTVTILNAANSLIQNNPKLFEKKLWSDFGVGNAIRLMACRNEDAEADTIARKIMLQQLNSNSKFADFAILYRGNHQARAFEQALRNYKIPYTISGGKSFFDKAEIKDIMAYLRLILNEDDDIAFIRAITTPKRGIGQTTLARLSDYAVRRKISLFAALFEEGFASTCNGAQLDTLLSFGNFINDFQFRREREEVGVLVNDLLAKINYTAYLYDVEEVKAAEKRLSTLQSFITWLTKKNNEDGKTLVQLVQTVNLISMLEENEQEELDAVKLSTLHAAKGLEYPSVFLISCEEGILPHHESISLDKVEEERRLMYVGITRAQHELTISYCASRRRAGETQVVERSRFLSEIGNHNIIDEASLGQQKIADKGELMDKFLGLKNLLKSN